MDSIGADRCAPTQPALHARLQLGRAVLGEGDGQNLFRLGVPVLDQPGNSLYQNRGFARSGSGQHQHGPGDVLDGRPLGRAGNESGFLAHGGYSALCENKAKVAMGFAKKVEEMVRKTACRVRTKRGNPTTLRTQKRKTRMRMRSTASRTPDHRDGSLCSR